MGKGGIPVEAIIAALLGGLNGLSWKQALLQKGEAWARAELIKRWKAKLDHGAAHVARDMTAQGWTWTDVDKKGVPDEGLGPGFVLSRDALYRIIRETGVPGGALRDAWRDGADNAVWAMVAPKIDSGTTIEEIVRLTGDAFVDHTL